MSSTPSASACRTSSGVKPVPERFRYIPFLLYEDDHQGERAAFDGVRCTACGICAKVSPPQCIWIVQGKGDDGRPRPVATEFYIDAKLDGWRDRKGGGYGIRIG